MLSVLIPNRNEPNIEKFVKEIADLKIASEIIVSSDREGKGKGWALKQAIEQAQYPYIIFVDGDYDIEPYEIRKFLAYIYQYDIVVGRKRIVQMPMHRKVITLLSRLYIKLLFGLDVDTQTGIKAFNYKPEFRTRGFGFTMEILYRAKKEGKNMIEIPIRAKVSDSKGIKVLWKTFKESMRIKFRL